MWFAVGDHGLLLIFNFNCKPVTYLYIAGLAYGLMCMGDGSKIDSLVKIKLWGQ